MIRLTFSRCLICHIHITRQICVHTSDLSVKVTLSTETQPLITMTAPVTIQTRDSNLRDTRWGRHVGHKWWPTVSQATSEQAGSRGTSDTWRGMETEWLFSCWMIILLSPHLVSVLLPSRRPEEPSPGPCDHTPDEGETGQGPGDMRHTTVITKSPPAPGEPYPGDWSPVNIMICTSLCSQTGLSGWAGPSLLDPVLRLLPHTQWPPPLSSWPRPLCSPGSPWPPSRRL